MTAVKANTTKAAKKPAASKRRTGKNASNAGNSTSSDVTKTPQKDRPTQDINNEYDEEYDLKKGLDVSPMKKNDYHGSANGSVVFEPPRDKSRYKYRVEIQQMMFVSGETNDPHERTTDLIEDIVRDQVVSLIMLAHKTAYARGQKSLLPEDLIFVIRHDKAKVNRLRTYLSWKDVRKNAKDQENGEIGGGASGGAGGGDLLEDAVGGGGASGNTGAAVDSRLLAAKQKRSLKLPWELEFMFQEQPLSMGKDEDDKIDEEEREAVLAQIKRLRQNDERTRNMTQQEYVHWSECRQASFTFRKGKRFREWCGIPQITDSRPNDDVIDILGFLTFELVCSITEEALSVKAALDKSIEEQSSHRYLFMEPSNDNRPISVEHIQEAWRRLQQVSIDKRALYNFRGGRILRAVKFI